MAAEPRPLRLLPADLEPKLVTTLRELLISGVHAQPLVALERSGALERIGPENLFASYEEALEVARELAAQPTSRRNVSSASM